MENENTKKISYIYTICKDDMSGGGRGWKDSYYIIDIDKNFKLFNKRINLNSYQNLKTLINQGRINNINDQIDNIYVHNIYK